jgi:predicted HTH transcriptional regulator
VYKIGSLLKPTESRHVEYKAGGGGYQRFHLPGDVRKYGSAFLNTSGGTLTVGVADDGMLVSPAQ